MTSSPQSFFFFFWVACSELALRLPELYMVLCIIIEWNKNLLYTSAKVTKCFCNINKSEGQSIVSTESSLGWVEHTQLELEHLNQSQYSSHLRSRRPRLDGTKTTVWKGVQVLVEPAVELLRMWRNKKRRCHVWWSLCARVLSSRVTKKNWLGGLHNPLNYKAGYCTH